MMVCNVYFIAFVQYLEFYNITLTKALIYVFIRIPNILYRYTSQWEKICYRWSRYTYYISYFLYV